MSQATNTKLMSTEAGGEQTQYEGANTFIKPHAKEQGQFGNSSINEATAHVQEDKSVRGKQTAENIRYGQAISESGFGGETMGMSGSAQQSGYGRTEGVQKDDDGQTRREQGYGGGNNVGA